MLWHVDDINKYHVDTKVVDSALVLIKEAYGRTSPLTGKQGKMHKYMGMTLDLYKYIKLNITMIKYINSIISESPSEMYGEATSLTVNNPFEAKDYSKDLTPE